MSWVYRHVDVAIAVGQHNRDYFLAHGLPPERIDFAPHAVDTVRFADPSGHHQQQALTRRQSLGLSENDFVFLYAGKLIWEKDLELLIDAFKRLNRPAHLVLLGGGPLEGALRGRAAGHSNIHFLAAENQAAMPAVYRFGTVFVLPSKSETWGLALNEAMASQRAVIASNRVAAARDLVQDGVTGWAFPSGDTEALASTLRAAFDCRASERRKMENAALALIQAWSSEVAARSIASSVIRFAHRNVRHATGLR